MTALDPSKNWPRKTYHLLNQAKHIVEQIFCDRIRPLQKLTYHLLNQAKLIVEQIFCDRIRPLQKLAPKNSESSLVYDFRVPNPKYEILI